MVSVKPIAFGLRRESDMKPAGTIGGIGRKLTISEVTD
jgi:hypothetical protein